VAFYHSPEWFRAFLDHLCDEPEQVYFCVLRDQDRMVAVVPLRRRAKRVGGVSAKVLEVPQDAEHMPASDVILAAGVPPAAAVGAVLEGLGGVPELRWDAVRLEHLPGGSACMPAFDQLPAWRGLRRVAGYRDVMTLESYEAWFAGISRKSRHNLRQHANRLGRAGTGRFSTARDLPALKTALDALLEIEDSGWKGRAGTSIKRSPRLTAFYGALVERFGSRGECLIHMLHLDGRPIAANLDLCFGKSAFMLKTAYDENNAQLGPGNLLADYSFRYYCLETQVRTFNLMSHSETHRAWNPVNEPELHLGVYQRTPAGLAAYAWDWAAPLASEAYHRTFRRAWRAAARRLARLNAGVRDPKPWEPRHRPERTAPRTPHPSDV